MSNDLENLLTPELKARWVEALRSNKYKQGRGHLRMNEKYCCLGVLADVVDPLGWYEPGRLDWGDQHSIRRGGDECISEYYVSDSAQMTLANMNDNREMNFNDIADWIEAGSVERPLE